MEGSMAMQVSWIDADHLKGLVAQIMPAGAPPTQEEVPPPREAEPTAMREDLATWLMPEPVAEEEEEKIEAVQVAPTQDEAPPLGRIRDKLKAIRQRASEAGILARGKSTPSHEVVAPAEVDPQTTQKAIIPFEIPPGARAERATAFTAWARQVLGAEGAHVLVMNEEGELLCGGGAKASLVLSAMMALGAATRCHAQAACEVAPVTRRPLASGEVLTVIPCEVPTGIMHAAVVAPSGLDDGLALVLRSALTAALQTQGSGVTS